MKTLHLLAGLASAVTLVHAGAQEAPADFALRLPIQTEDAGHAHYRASLPLTAYLASRQGDLADLRVFNAAGEAVAYALLAPQGEQEQRSERVALRWIPLRGEAPAAADSGAAVLVSVKQAADGSLLEIKTATARKGTPAAPPISGYLLDLSRIEGRARAQALHIDWTDAGRQFQLVELAASDDLRHWRTLTNGAQLARLEHEGTRIEQRRIEYAAGKERYLRLQWREPRAAPALIGIELELGASIWRAPALAWSDPLVAQQSEPAKGEYRYRLPHALPISRLRFELPPGNRLLSFELQRPAQGKRPPQAFARGLAFRLESQGRVWQQEEFALPGAPLAEFTLRLDPRLWPGPQVPQLRYALAPGEIVFLASGAGPYALAVGHPRLRGAALPVGTLVPAFGREDSPRIGAATVANVAAGSLPAAVTGEVVETRKYALWAVLGLGVLGLAAMAWQLIRQMRGTARQ